MLILDTLGSSIVIVLDVVDVFFLDIAVFVIVVVVVVVVIVVIVVVVVIVDSAVVFNLLVISTRLKNTLCSNRQFLVEPFDPICITVQLYF